ncbi:iron-containing alcohol dehydrogenase [Chrysiogenes arsenatis]|uniref:iron-containing alcohol dehydrogenase n=1 Tax=Chrysiogenes arsenatis TaxID=309797 RepID=UPI0004042BBD|nr:iron-containing alcohol dehydrogenase [Chrysiogenes arsenatis]
MIHDFVFHNPTKIIFGVGKEEKIGKELASRGHRKTLLVYGQESVRRSGLLSRVQQNLAAHGVDFIEHGGVVSNPLLSHTQAGVDLARREHVDSVLAVGGGSVVDEAKAIAVGAKLDGELWDCFLGNAPIRSALPIFDILTIAATGSEMNGNSVILNERKQQKYAISSPYCYPTVSILNPALTCSVPADYTAYSAVDAIAHVIEAYFTQEVGGNLQNRLVESIIKTVIETTDTIMADPNHLGARSEFMWTATLALNGVTTAGVSGFSFPNHLLEHSLSALYRIAHGAGLAIIIPAWMKWHLPQWESQYQRFAREVFGVNDSLSGVQSLEAWFKKIGAPTRLADAGIPASEIPTIVANISDAAQVWGLANVYTPEVITQILQFANEQ